MTITIDVYDTEFENKKVIKIIITKMIRECQSEKFDLKVIGCL